MRRALPALALPAAAAVLLALAGCASDGSGHASAPSAAHPTAAATARAGASAASCHGVFVTVQYGVLGRPDTDACAPTTGTITAAAALKAVGVSTAGTRKYGDQVVCRVNGLPSASAPITVPGHAAYVEKCQGMPAAFAYWGVWVRPSAGAKWAYAQNGVTTEQLKPGESLGLKFATGSDAAPPRS